MTQKYDALAERWELKVRLHSEHRIWKDKSSGFGLAIADMSGDGRIKGAGIGNPDQTDDGALWLRPDQDILIGFDDGRLNVGIPVLGNDQQPRGFVPGDVRDLPQLMRLGLTKFKVSEKAFAHISALSKSFATLQALGVLAFEQPARLVQSDE